ncbi:MAG: zinc-finger domain-containing protein [Rhodothalassiaceae bacterium]
MSIPPPETIYVEDTVVACDGGEGALGHPRVFLNMGADGAVECPYCDRLFILAGGPKDKRGSKGKKARAA